MSEGAAQDNLISPPLHAEFPSTMPSGNMCGKLQLRWQLESLLAHKSWRRRQHSSPELEWPCNCERQEERDLCHRTSKHVTSEKKNVLLPFNEATREILLWNVCILVDTPPPFPFSPKRDFRDVNHSSCSGQSERQKQYSARKARKKKTKSSPPPKVTNISICPQYGTVWFWFF